jgi:hypothetical protein
MFASKEKQQAYERRYRLENRARIAARMKAYEKRLRNFTCTVCGAAFSAHATRRATCSHECTKKRRNDGKKRYLADMKARVGELIPLTIHGTFAMVPLTQGKWTKIDIVDWPRASMFMWCSQQTQDGAWYAVGTPYGKQKPTGLHRFLLDAPDGREVDHWDGNGLNNTRRNLRVCTHVQNMANKAKWTEGPSKFKGVTVSVDGWFAKISNHGLSIALGVFSSEVEAARVYDEAARQLYGEFSRPNIPEPETDDSPAPIPRAGTHRDGSSQVPT